MAVSFNVETCIRLPLWNVSFHVSRRFSTNHFSTGKKEEVHGHLTSFQAAILRISRFQPVVGYNTKAMTIPSDILILRFLRLEIQSFNRFPRNESILQQLRFTRGYRFLFSLKTTRFLRYDIPHGS